MLKGHLLAFLSVFIWSSLYIQTSLLLESFNPFTLLVLQCFIGYLFLLIVYPKFCKILSLKEELLFLLASLLGIVFYNLFLNLSMEVSSPSNVSIIIATSPLWTCICAFFLRIEKPYLLFFVGFFISIFGVVLLNFESFLSFNLKGDILALLSSLSWGLYAILIAKLLHYDIVFCVRKILFYGLLLILSLSFVFDFNFTFYKSLDFINSINLLFVGIFSTGICFVLWFYATKLIGAVSANIYVYLTPVITIVVAFFVLDYKLSLLQIFGVIFVLIGVFVSERKPHNKKTKDSK